MYSKQQAALLKQSFWTAFGRYMSPVPSADGSKINWINYKTGVKNLFFRMDVTNNSESIAIVVANTENPMAQQHFRKLVQLRSLLREHTGEDWNVSEEVSDAFGKKISSIGKAINDVNVFEEATWPAIISFLKPRVIALDAFWYEVKDLFE